MLWVFSNGLEDATLGQFLVINRYLFNFIFSWIVRIDKLHTCVEGTCLLNNRCYRKVKRLCFSCPSNNCKGDKIIDQERRSYPFELPLIKDKY